MATYIVKPGDTLSEIAQKYGTTYQAIAQANGISNPNLIYAGQTLNIGGGSTSSSAGSTSSNTSSTTNSSTTTTTPDKTTPDAAAPETPTEATAPKFEYGEYKPSDMVTQAEQLLNQQLSQKPGEYQSTWQEQLNETLQQILNREKFSYDINGDALYQQYKDQYTNKGQMAMMDTMGQAQAMTGGYGNSYAQSVGQQVYQGHLQELNNKIPELYQLAMNKYQMEGDELLNQAALMAQQEEQDYGRYRDQLGDWQTERDYLSNRYDTERDYDYGKWADGRDFAYSQFADDRAYDYQVGRDKISDEQWQKEFEEAQRQFNQQHGVYSGGSGGSSGSSSSSSSSRSSSSSSSSYDSDTAGIQQMLRNAGYNIAVDGIWGPETQAAYDSYYGNTNDDPKGFREVASDISNMIDMGASRDEGEAAIQHAINAGLITGEQAKSLKYTMLPSKLLY